MNKTSTLLSEVIKILLSLLFLLCLIDMPYGYFQLVRFVALLGFVVLGAESLREGSSAVAMVYFALALLFQPFLKIPLGREIWNLVDVVVALALILSMFRWNNISR